MSGCCQGGFKGGFQGLSQGGFVDDPDFGHHDHHRESCCFPGSFRKNYALVASIPRNRQTGVSPNIKAIKLVLRRDYNNTRGLVDVETTIDMWQGSTPVPVRIKRVSDSHGWQRVLLVIPLVPLVGGVIYKVRISTTYFFRDGTIIPKCRLIVFSTRCR